jgi:hypothetical protein
MRHFSGLLPNTLIRLVLVSVRIRPLVLVVAGCGLMLALPPMSTGAAGTTPQPSVDMIRDILASDGIYTRSTTSANNQYKSTTERKFSLSEADGCKLTVVSDSHVHAEMPEMKRVTDRRTSETFRPDFSTMDASSVYVGDQQPAQATWVAKGYLVRIAVEIGKPPIPVSSVDNETKQSRELLRVPNLAVYVSSRQSADRLAKAFAELATACHAGASGK